MTCVQAMDRLRLGTVASLREHCVRRGRFPGNGRLVEVLDTLDVELVHSQAERIGRRAIRAAGLRPEPRPYVVMKDGIRLAEIDIAFPPLLYGVEIDGPHHLMPAMVQADKVRDRQLEQQQWRIDRFSADEVCRRPELFAAAVRRGVVASALRLGLPTLDPRWMVTTGG